jgi:2'-5' RNA ligase
VEGGERLRLFCGLRLPDDVLDRIAAWQREHLRGRVVGRDNLHVTLAFLGGRPAEDVATIADALASMPMFAPMLFRVRGYRETRSVGMLVLDDVTGAATAAAEQLHEQLELLGIYEREKRRWLAHVTVLRFREPPRLRPPVPELGTFAPSEAAVYLSRLRPGGAQYQVLESFPVGGSPSGS